MPYPGLYFLTKYMLVSSLPMKSRERLAHGVTYTSSTHTRLVDVVTNTNCQTQNGCAQVRAFAPLERRGFSKLSHKPRKKNCRDSIADSIHVIDVRDSVSDSIPVNSDCGSIFLNSFLQKCA